MRLFVVLFAMLMTVTGALAAPVPKFSKMTIEQIESYFSNKTALMHERGLLYSVFYFRSNGTVYVWPVGATKALKTKWSIDYTGKDVGMCLDAVSGRLPRSAGGGKVTTRYCLYARDLLKSSVDIQAGDVLGLSKRSRLPALPPAKLSRLDALKAAMGR